jgi:hypothetical protein
MTGDAATSRHAGLGQRRLCAIDGRDSRSRSRRAFLRARRAVRVDEQSCVPQLAGTIRLAGIGAVRLTRTHPRLRRRWQATPATSRNDRTGGCRGTSGTLIPATGAPGKSSSSQRYGQHHLIARRLVRGLNQTQRGLGRCMKKLAAAPSPPFPSFRWSTASAEGWASRSRGHPHAPAELGW